MSYKNLRSPASNSPDTGKEQIAPVPVIDDARKNGDTVNNTPDREPLIKWGPPDAAPANESGGSRPPMKLNK